MGAAVIEFTVLGGGGRERECRQVDSVQAPQLGSPTQSRAVSEPPLLTSCPAGFTAQCPGRAPGSLPPGGLWPLSQAVKLRVCRLLYPQDPAIASASPVPGVLQWGGSVCSLCMMPQGSLMQKNARSAHSLGHLKVCDFLFLKKVTKWNRKD